MHIKQLISFVTVARNKNMAQTALALNYSHSTIFGHLEALEKEEKFAFLRDKKEYFDLLSKYM